MSELQPTTPEKLQRFWNHIERVALEVRSWPEWKKAFACDLYEFPAKALGADEEQGVAKPRTSP